MRKRKTGASSRIILILFCLQLSLFPSLFDARAGNMGIFEKTQTRMVNLEATYLLHVLKLVQWREKDLPATDHSLKCLIVGEDITNFSERFSFLVSESNATVSDRNIIVHSMGEMKDALALAHRDKSVVLIVALESAADQWNKSMNPKRAGLLFYGQSEKFLGHGMAMCSQISRNRVKISVNARKAASKGLTLSPELLSQDRIFFVDKKEE